MHFEIPTINRTTSSFKCKCCNAQINTISFSKDEFCEEKIFLDFGRDVPLNQDIYLNNKYWFCENCGNIGFSIDENNIEKYDNEVVQILANTNLLNTEKLLLIKSIISPSFETLLDLYWYYENTKNNKSNKTREQMILLLNNQQKDIYTLYFLVELYRRNGDFKTARKLIKKAENIDKNETDKTKIKENTDFIRLLKTQNNLCKKEISTREYYDAIVDEKWFKKRKKRFE